MVPKSFLLAFHLEKQVFDGLKNKILRTEHFAQLGFDILPDPEEKSGKSVTKSRIGSGAGWYPKIWYQIALL